LFALPAKNLAAFAVFFNPAPDFNMRRVNVQLLTSLISPKADFGSLYGMHAPRSSRYARSFICIKPMFRLNFFIMDRIAFIGIELGDGRGPCTFAVVDEGLAILALSRGSPDAVLAYAAGQSRCLIALSGPLTSGLAKLTRPEVRADLQPPPPEGEWLVGRVAEYLLSCRGFPVLLAPQPGRRAALSARRSLVLSARLAEIGFGQPDYPDLGLIEAQAPACFESLLGRAPFASASLEGRIQRQLLLHKEKLPLPDPMDFFEEVTRHKLLNGILPDQEIYSQPELDALVAAFTAWLSRNKPARVQPIGDPQEGQIVLPLPSKL
jgi:hypothetical protein